MLKKILSDKINVTKMHSFSFCDLPNHQSFTFNSRFLYELKLDIRLTKSVWDCPFSIPFHFYESLYFCSAKNMNLLTLRRHNSFQN